MNENLPPPPAAIAADWAFLWRHPAHFLACGCGSGLSPKLPGTIGTLFAWLSFILLRSLMSETSLAVLVMVAIGVGVYLCGKTSRALGGADHPSIVWDEIAAFWLILFLIPQGLWWSISSFVLFRFFDITKPPPIAEIDARWKNGCGIMADDLLAAGYTLIILAFCHRVTAYYG